MVELENIKAGYNGKEVLHNISFSLKSGQNLCIVGPNGCGKTTLLRAIAGILPFSGQVRICGENIKTIRHKELAKKVGMLSQSSTIYFNYTVMEMVMMGRYAHDSGGFFGGESSEDRLAVREALETVGMLAQKDREVDSLSGGQLQRVFLAKILAQDPQIILLDEPTNHLDLSYQIELIRFLKSWSTRPGKMVIGVLHDINLAMQLADQAMLMDNGKILTFGQNQDVFASDTLAEVYQMDVAGYMLETLEKWKTMPTGR